jgi:hypothetical protein
VACPVQPDDERFKRRTVDVVELAERQRMPVNRKGTRTRSIRATHRVPIEVVDRRTLRLPRSAKPPAPSRFARDQMTVFEVDLPADQRDSCIVCHRSQSSCAALRIAARGTRWQQRKSA